MEAPSSWCQAISVTIVQVCTKREGMHAFLRKKSIQTRFGFFWFVLESIALKSWCACQKRTRNLFFTAFLTYHSIWFPLSYRTKTKVLNIPRCFPRELFAPSPWPLPWLALPKPLSKREVLPATSWCSAKKAVERSPPPQSEFDGWTCLRVWVNLIDVSGF